MKQALIAVALLLALATPVLAQCSMCEGSAAAGSDGGAVYNRSTLFMLSVPYLLLGGVAGYVVYAFRRTRPAPPADDSLNPSAVPSGSAPESPLADQR